MRAVYVVVLLIAFAIAAYGQTDANSITVLSSRSVTLQADEAVFITSVTSSLNTGFDDVLAALSGFGITTDNFQSVYSYGGSRDQMMLEWNFTLVVPLSKLKATTTMLEGLRQAMSVKHPELTVNYGLENTQVSSQLQESQQCPLTDLIADARAQAQKLASASPGLSVGPIIALSDGSSGLNQRFIPSVYFISGDFSGPRLGLASFLLGVPSYGTASNCSVMVKFSLLHY